jgi:hypothetical protein
MFPIARLTDIVLCSCFAHVVNLGLQRIYGGLEDGTGLNEQFLLGNTPCVNNAALQRMVLPEGVTTEKYQHVLESDVVGSTRKLIATCRVSGKRCEEFQDMILEGNLEEKWRDDDGKYSQKILQLLRDCETRWSLTHLMVDRVLLMLPVVRIKVSCLLVVL